MTRVELPLGLPLLLAGVRIAAVFVIATATIAGIAGVERGGLGQIMVEPVTYGVAGVLAAAFCVAADRASDELRARARTARGLAQDGPEGVGSRGREPGSGSHERRALMFRKHTRRAAKAAFAISFGVALLIGLTACGGGGG